MSEHTYTVELVGDPPYRRAKAVCSCGQWDAESFSLGDMIERHQLHVRRCDALARTPFAYRVKTDDGDDLIFEARKVTPLYGEPGS